MRRIRILASFLLYILLLCILINPTQAANRMTVFIEDTSRSEATLKQDAVLIANFVLNLSPGRAAIHGLMLGSGVTHLASPVRPVHSPSSVHGVSSHVATVEARVIPVI